MKKGILLVLMCLLVCSTASADILGASTSIPAPDGITTVTTHVTVPTSWGATATELNFGPLTNLKTYGNFKVFTQPDPGFYFAMDVGYTYTGGAEITQITTSYTEGVMPPGQAHGLGWKTIATFVTKSTDSAGNELPDEPITTIGPRSNGKLCLIDLLAGQSVLLSDLTGKWLRIYFGLATKADQAGNDNGEPLYSEVFSPGDAAGDYSGEVTITSS